MKKAAFVIACLVSLSACESTRAAPPPKKTAPTHVASAKGHAPAVAHHPEGPEGPKGPKGPEGPKGPKGPEGAAAEQDRTHGRELLDKYECTRCHEIQGVPATTVDFDCSGCHRRILAGDMELVKVFDTNTLEMERYQRRIRSLTVVPELASTSRFRRSWVEGFLQEPHDLRPNLLATMPRFEMPPEDAKALAAFLVPDEERPRPQLGDAEKGRKLMEGKGCMSCHRFTGAPSVAAMPVTVPLTAAQLSEGQQLAPDLRYARDRLRPEALVNWIADPMKIKSETQMPTIPMSDQEARDMAAFIVDARLEPIAYDEVPKRLPVLERRVTWSEVYDRVFGANCRHCHSDPHEVIGDGGPGFVGGFGFRKRALDLSTYPGANSGSLDDEGKRRSVFKKNADGVPKIVAHLRARQREVAGKNVEGVRGMPLGLPPLPPEDIQLIETWIEQGRPR